jgi:hypothetical protein
MDVQRHLNSKEFVDRARSRVARYGVSFGTTRLREWIRQKLVHGAVRGSNVGKRPMHYYGRTHYRRVLQIARFYGMGIKDTDELFVRLFRAGYCLPSQQVRNALLIEFKKAQSKLNASLRSAYYDRSDNVPPGRMRQIAKQWGPVDPRFKGIDLNFADNIMLAIVRAGRNPAIPVVSRSQNTNDHLNENFDVTQLKCMSEQFFHGMLAKDDEFGSLVEELIISSSDDQYRCARVIFRSMLSGIGWLAQHDDGKIALGAETALQGLQQREFLAFQMVLALRMATAGNNPD